MQERYDSSDMQSAGMPNGQNQLPNTEEWQHIGRLEGSDLKVADDETDVRGWTVRSKDGRVMGTVTDLLVNTRVMLVEFIEVSTELDPSHHIILPIRDAVLDEEKDEVQFIGIADGAVGHSFGSPGMADSELTADTSRFFGSRRAGREEHPYISPSSGNLG